MLAPVYNFEAYLPPFLRNVIHEKLNSLRVWLIENGLLAESTQAGTESTLVKAAREAVEAVEAVHLGRELAGYVVSVDGEVELLTLDRGGSASRMDRQGRRVRRAGGNENEGREDHVCDD